MVDCIQPPDAGCFGATAEISLRDIFGEQHFKLTESCGECGLTRLPFDLGNSPDTQVDHQLSGLTRSAQLALDCVNASIADNEKLNQDCDALRQRLNAQFDFSKLIIEAFLADTPPLSVNEVGDPFTQLEKVDDEEHQE
ncbi:LOW QUALITY PROTEIN: hypothetical protein PHPALM_5831 [Phytophthora palmivora]|uniref:Uncharacterized protein n=1 Tax=Phytophthora palmivora TaxID=4796 RepID=A0A2P4YGE8_9STRA|nr:LOW QUALITY PROTEIN: hypothetical protein PHPALM_5831 [Phytophthora palmivora]